LAASDPASANAVAPPELTNSPAASSHAPAVLHLRKEVTSFPRPHTKARHPLQQF
jgi:hypothetical protein